MCVVYFIGTAYFFDDPFSKLILISQKMFPGFMHLARFQRSLQWWRGTLHLQAILNRLILEHLFHSVLKFICALDISSKWIFLTLAKLSIQFIRTLIIKPFQPRRKRKFAKCIRRVCQLFFRPSCMLRKNCIHQCLQNYIFNDAKVKLTSPFWCTDV